MTAKLGFAFSFRAGKLERYALIFCRSIRLYGGKQKSAPIFAMIPNSEYDKLDEKNLEELKSLDAEVISFEFTPPVQPVYYAMKSVGAGAAEMYAMDKVDQLIYTDVESLYLNDPSLMALDRGKKLGIRPVDIKNIGLGWKEPVNDFWAHIYDLLNVPEENIFPVITTIDFEQLKTYLNACLLTVKPENGLLQKWSANFLRLVENPVWNEFFERDEFYKIFLHQAILNGTILAELTEDEIEIYSIHVNFPLHFYAKHPHKPQWIDELVTCRLDMLDIDNCWKNWLPMRDPLKSWLIDQYEGLNLDVPLPDQL